MASAVADRYHVNVKNRPQSIVLAAIAIALAMGTTSCGRSSRTRLPDLPEQPDRWVTSVAFDADSRLKYVGRTRDYLITTIGNVKPLDSPRAISVGDEVQGVRIGAIKCSFFWSDASYGGEQFMWRGRWGCKAGRTTEEVEKAVGPDGQKRFEYLYVSPVSLTN